MKRAATTYLVMLAVCIAGIWVILIQGSRLQAPPDLAGTWTLTALASEGTEKPIERTAIVEQSGRFVCISFDGAPFVDYRLESERNGTEAARLSNASEALILISPDGGAEGIVRFERRPADAAGGRIATYAAERVDARDAASLQADPGESSAHSILLLIAQLTVIILASRVLGTTATYFRQPRVVGEMIAGLMLGPSLLGWTFPEVSATLFPADSIPFLGLLAQLGVIFFLFIIGLELNPQLLRNRGHIALVISHVSIVAPFLLGAALALYLYGRVFNDTPQMSFSSVALFMGAAMSITAFPVLARILTERNLHKTQVGAISITCAAVDDVSAWCLLAFVVGLARAEGLSQAAGTTVLAAVYVVIMLFAVRPFLRRIEVYYDREGKLTNGVLGVLVIVVLCSSLATEAIGIHALFGAFMAGAIMPKGGRFVREVTGRVESFTLIVLLPIFFAFTGLKTRIELLNSPELWLMTGLIISVACAGKFGGSTLAAVSCGMKWREASAIGILMNTRGLMELVILNIGRELGVITDAVFAMMVLMAVVTTLLTTPILDWVYPDRLIRVRPAPAPMTKGRRHDAVLIPISLPRSGRALIRLADLITGPANAARRVIGLHLRRAEEHEAYSSAEPAIEPLDALQTCADEVGLTVDRVSFVSRDAASDIARTAADYGAGLILMGFHKPVIGSTILGGTVHRVFADAPADVAVLLDRGLPERPASILVPYLNSDHTRLALDLAATIARHVRATVTILHVVPPNDGGEADGRERLHAKSVADKIVADPTQPASIAFKVIESADPIDAVLQQCKPFDLVVIGTDEQWGLQSQLFGWNAERIARDCPTSMLIVRRARQEAPASDAVRIEAQDHETRVPAITS